MYTCDIVIYCCMYTYVLCTAAVTKLNLFFMALCNDLRVMFVGIICVIINLCVFVCVHACVHV